MGIPADGPPDETSPITPVIEQNALRKGLPPGGDHNDIVLARRSLERFCPVKFERFELQRIQPEQEFRGPLKTEAPFLRSGVDQEVLKARWPDDPPLALQFSARGVGAPGDPLGLLWFDFRREGRDSISQDRVIRRGGERRFLASACAGRRGASGERKQRDQSDGQAKS